MDAISPYAPFANMSLPILEIDMAAEYKQCVQSGFAAELQQDMLTVATALIGLLDCHVSHVCRPLGCKSDQTGIWKISSLKCKHEVRVKSFMKTIGKQMLDTQTRRFKFIQYTQK